MSSNDDTHDLEQRLWVFVLSKLVETTRDDAWVKAETVWKKLIEKELGDVEKRLAEKLTDLAKSRDKEFLAMLRKYLPEVGAGLSEDARGRGEQNEVREGVPATEDEARRARQPDPFRKKPPGAGGANARLGGLSWGSMLFGLVVGAAAAGGVAWMMRPADPPQSVITGSGSATPATSATGQPNVGTASQSEAQVLDAAWQQVLAKDYKTVAPATKPSVNQLLCEPNATCTYQAFKDRNAQLDLALQATMDLVRERASCSGALLDKDGLMGPGTAKRFVEIRTCVANSCTADTCKIPEYVEGDPAMLEGALRYLATSN